MEKGEKMYLLGLVRDIAICAVITVLFVGGSYMVLSEMAEQQGRYEQVNQIGER